MGNLLHSKYFISTQSFFPDRVSANLSDVVSLSEFEPLKKKKASKLRSFADTLQWPLTENFRRYGTKAQGPDITSRMTLQSHMSGKKQSTGSAVFPSPTSESHKQAIRLHTHRLSLICNCHPAQDL